MTRLDRFLLTCAALFAASATGCAGHLAWSLKCPDQYESVGSDSIAHAEASVGFCPELR